ncbi:phospholipid-translocating ATPase [Capronia coronata CBS 617.96]|uniref:Phospholipid-transporting ATPase n=1 Tax=Capronia coronata CBS 617.96 TaxID=1182541 RepID=W9XPI6_9EURO|nr:phospholipid-translocating ATPase [Capronia coronata CBS 617.96]EXJ78856.1 phospholipid-translocating ATPase [Capronia coronata CBS 617.96]
MPPSAPQDRSQHNDKNKQELDCDAAHQSADQGTQSSTTPAAPSSAMSSVRFSVEIPTADEAAVEPRDPRPSSEWKPHGILKSPSKGRNRGYSLRRALFAQNIQTQSSNDNGAFELDSAKRSTGDSQWDTSDKTRNLLPSTTVTVQETGETEGLAADGRRLSECALELPLYQRWLSKQHSRPTPFQRLRQSYVQLRERFVRANDVPPSLDGRHVKVNVLSTAGPVDERTGKLYINNNIRSCRYTPWNFVPRQLVAQFGKLANFYFLCVSILQMIPGLSTTGTYTTIIPLLIFVAISMAKEGYDDFRRHRLDKEENGRLATVLTFKSSPGGPGGLEWQEKKWADLRVGDAVLLKRDAGVPADLVLLRADDPTGTAYAETKSLDGETNLKPKKPVPEVSGACQSLESIADLAADFVVEDPNLDLYKFDGRVTINGKTLPLTNTEILYRGSVLRNTISAVGLVIYSGEECKIRMNANKTPRVKAPALQAKVNRIVVLVASLVFFMAIILTIAYEIWRRTTENKSWYLQSARVPFGHILTSFIIMLNTMLPLSLYVSLEIIKLAQMFLLNDIDMYDPESDTPMEAHTSTINEELGQVNYIFSDKTGTLTNNSMKFRRMSVAGTAWLHDLDLQEEAANEAGWNKLKHKKRGGKRRDARLSKEQRQSTSRLARKSAASTGVVPGHSSDPGEVDDKPQWQASEGPGLTLETGRTQELLDYIHRRPQTIFARRVRFFLLSLALCHTCIPEKDEDDNIRYQAASPDEMALVTGAQELGYIVTDRQSTTVTVKTFEDGDEENPSYETYEVLDVIEFSSARKRMSIIVRFPDQRICLISKGADSTIRGLLRLSDLAASKVQAAERRASQRKSVEAQQVLSRRSLQLSRMSNSIHAIDPVSPRPSNVSVDRSLTTRESVDIWLRDREQDAGASRQRIGFHFYSRPSAQFGPSRSEKHAANSQRSPQSTPRASMQVDEKEELVEESLVVDENAVFERCFQHIDDFATEGLRTLLYGYRFISDEEYKTWKQVYASAATSLVERQEKIERAAEMLENKLELLGATAIEDKLQKGVPDAIDRLRRAGIRMWMLTGDKRETAINIGHSCRLIKDYSTVIVLDHELGDLPARMTSAFAQINSDKTAHSVLVVDGQTLIVIDADPAAKALFTDVAIRADSVICCRASPSQKASLVKTIRTKVKGSVTLAVGDGANDIAMIQEAHVGIGIAGKEGLQAARTSDYSVAQFRFLLKLLLVHGRWNYVRICKYILGTFWKEMLFYLVQAIYQRWNGYTGTSLYESWSLSMFNTLFTSLPVIFMGVFEKDLAASTLLAVPELYSFGQRNRGFNFKLYFSWAILGACEAVIVYFIMYEIYGRALFTRDQELYAMGSLAFSGCIIIISLKLQFIELHNKTVTAAVAIFLSVGGWWLWNIFLSCVYPDDVVYSVKHGLLDGFGRNLMWWITLLLIVSTVYLLEVTIKAHGTALWPSDVDIFQGFEQDLEVRKRFEEAAADLLQQGWDPGMKKSSLELAREAAEQAEREAHVQELLEKPRNMGERRPWARRTPSGLSIHNAGKGVAVQKKEDGRDMEEGIQRKSTDIGELFSKGFGAVRKGPELR